MEAVIRAGPKVLRLFPGIQAEWHRGVAKRYVGITGSGKELLIEIGF
jgi:hypothetical protein